MSAIFCPFLAMMTDNFRKHTHPNPIERFLINIFYQKLNTELRKLNPQKILDVGCGEGFTLHRLKENHIGKELEGIEYLDTAIKLGKEHFPDIKIRKGTIYDLPYKDNSFDVVLCTEVLEHLEDPEKALKELKRVSSNFVVLTVPNEPFWMLANLLRGKNIKRWGNDIEHINHWTLWGFKKFISRELTILIATVALFWTIVVAKK